MFLGEANGRNHFKFRALIVYAYLYSRSLIFSFFLVVEVQEAVAVGVEVREDVEDLDNVLYPVLECESNIC